MRKLSVPHASRTRACACENARASASCTRAHAIGAAPMKPRLRINRLRIGVSTSILAFFVLGALLAPWVLADPLAGDYAQIFATPSLSHWFGCDMYGRDIFARVVTGARYSLGLSLICVSAPLLLGALIGSVSAFQGGALDAFLMRSAEMFQAFPEILIGILIVGIMGPGIWPVCIAIMVVMWVRYARLARSLIAGALHEPYIDVARLNGAGQVELLMRYIAPRVAPQFLTAALMDVGFVMLSLASFSFLGLGVTPPTPEWGAMMSEARTYLTSAPHLIMFPGLALLVAVLSIQTLGGALLRVFEARK